MTRAPPGSGHAPGATALCVRETAALLTPAKDPEPMRIVELDNAHRQKHFDFFRAMNHPHFSVCAPVDLTWWLEEVKRRGLHVTSSLTWLFAAAANAVPQLRQRIRGEQLVEHERVHPSFAVTTEGTDVFSFCEVEFQPGLEAFVADALVQIAERRRSPSFEDEEGRDDYLFMSAFPWVSFTSVTHPMNYHPHDCAPRITWGRFFEQGGKRLAPLSIQAHHAIVDGVHLGRFFEEVAARARGELPLS